MVLDGIIELPFALPTAVAGIALTHLTVVIAVCVRVREKKFVAYRQVTQELVQKGEKVNVFFSRVYVKTGDTVTLVRNSALTKEESIYI